MADKEEQSNDGTTGSGTTQAVIHDSNSQRLTSLLLNGRNFLPWSRAVTIALGGRSRLGHINGQIQVPLEKSPNFQEWQAHDHNVMSSLFNSMEPEVYEVFAYSDTAKTLWDSLCEMYGQANNASRIFELQQSLACSKQGSNQTFTEHLSSMKKQWDELRHYRPATKDVTDYVKREEQDRIFQLLASIKPEFEDTKRDILQRPQLPSFNTVCSIIQSEETRRRVMHPHSTYPAEEISTHKAVSNPKSGDTGTRLVKGKEKKPTRFHCEHCNRDGHSKERCWILYPHLRVTKERNLEAKTVVQGHSDEFQSKLESLALQVQHLLQAHSSGSASTNFDSGNLARVSGTVSGSHHQEDDW